MKKVLLAVLCAGLFFACGKKKAQEPETLVDTVPAQEVVQEEPAVEEPVAEEPVAQAAPAAPAKKATTAKKTTNANTGMTAAKKEETAPSVEDHAKSAANRVANKAIDKAEQDATNTIVNSGKKKR
jgi:hypothetical protein